MVGGKEQPKLLEHHFLQQARGVAGEKQERWKELCEHAANEQDPEKLLHLVKEINDLLDAKKHRSAEVSSSAQPKDAREPTR
jgi:hypothetical protein